jgi:hypothetical protein
VERIRIAVASWLLLGTVCALPLLGGCSDESKQSGTQVIETEKDKAVVNDMRNDMLKQERK